MRTTLVTVILVLLLVIGANLISVPPKPWTLPEPTPQFWTSEPTWHSTPVGAIP